MAKDKQSAADRLAHRLSEAKDPEKGGDYVQCAIEDLNECCESAPSGPARKVADRLQQTLGGQPKGSLVNVKTTDLDVVLNGSSLVESQQGDKPPKSDKQKSQQSDKAPPK